MKLRGLFIVLFMGGLTDLTCPADAQQTDPDRSSVEFGLRYDFTCRGKTSKVKFTVAVPQTIPQRQNISMRYFPKPSRIFDQNQVRYAEFVFDRPEKEFDVQIRIKADVFRYDLATVQKKQSRKLVQGPCIENFLRHERYIEKDDPNIQKIADSITADNQVELVRGIYNYVIDSIDYTGYSAGALGALEAVRHKSGDCTEYAYLFVALCRAKNIPAKVIHGFTTKFGTTPRHDWAEVYLAEYGWVPFDPAFGDKTGRIERSERFHNLEPIYIRRTHFEKDELLNDYNFYYCQYWGGSVKVAESIEF